MTRPLRIEYPNAIYHIYSRGNAGNPIFMDDFDRERLLSVLDLVVKRYHWLCHAYCLMDNHYHFIIETPEANLSKGMRQLNGIYTQKYNYRHKRPGHVFQGRFKAVIVDKDCYLLELSRYVVLNPLRKGIVAGVEDWKWSSYGATAGFKRKPEWLTVEWILSFFDDKKKKAERMYREFIKEGISKESPWNKIRGQILLGDENFIEKFKDLLAEKEQVKEIARHQRYLSRPDLGMLFKQTETKTKRNRVINQAHMRYGYDLKEIADYLKVHYTTVSKVIALGKN